MNEKYAVGVDFGTESVRAGLFSTRDGRMLESSVWLYSHGVISDELPESRVRLRDDWALQDPDDYVNGLVQTVGDVVRETGVGSRDVVGLGIDFTACTMMPTTIDGTPLCKVPRFRSAPHSWVKLWKHHAAQPEADLVNDTARRLGYNFLERYGGKISSEWFFPKALQILHEAPEVYDAADKLIEAQDWIVWQLTGNERRAAATAGYKAIYHHAEGFPDSRFFAALHPRLADVVHEKLASHYYRCGEKAGNLRRDFAQRIGLSESTAVAVANMDAHVSVPACTVTDTGRLVMIMGTSICHLVNGIDEAHAEGICGVVKDGIVPNLYGIEAGQSCVGDLFAWFFENCVPDRYVEEARRTRVPVQTLLEEKARKIPVGGSGLLALDWWNGNRSILVDANVTGVLLGATLATKPEEIFRAFIEATGFGTRVIVETLENAGVEIRELVACGGLPEKNKLLMQVFADVTRKTIRVAASPQTPALGAAMFGAVAASGSGGGFDDIYEAANCMAHLSDVVYVPSHLNSETYDALFAEYTQLHDYFGRGVNDVMKRLKRIKARAFGDP